MTDLSAPPPRKPSTARQRLAARATAVLRACGEGVRVEAKDVVRGAATRADRDGGALSWYARVQGRHHMVTVGSRLPMLACDRGPLYVVPEPLVETFHLYPQAEWPRGVVAPPGGALGVRSGNDVAWYDASGAPLGPADTRGAAR